MSLELNQQVQKVLDKVRPRLQSDGGDVELVRVTTDGVVEIRLTGACDGCPMSTLTVKSFIEQEIKKALPAVTEVITLDSAF
ncbi:MAG: NifU family protein [Elusimicrobiota bacterium]